MSLLKTAGSATLHLLGADASFGQAALRLFLLGFGASCAIYAVGLLSRSNACQDAEFDLVQSNGGGMLATGADAAQDRMPSACTFRSR